MLIERDQPPEAARAAGREGLFDPRLVYFRLPGAARETILEAFSERLVGRGLVRDAAELAARLIRRENDGCTGVGHGIAIPHCRLDPLDQEIVAFASADPPVDFHAADGLRVDLIFFVVSPEHAAAAHLQAVARVSRLLRVPGLPETLRAAGSAEGLFAALQAADAGVGRA